MKRSWQLSILVLIAVALIAMAFIFDGPMLEWINADQSDGLRQFMRKVSRFGDWWSHAALGIVLLAVAWRRGNKKWARIFLSMLIALAMAGAVARVVKIGVGRARPSIESVAAWNGPSLSARFSAFPSGHTAISTAFFGVLFFVSWRIGLACLPIPTLIGFSRIYVAAHYLSDVVCAAIIGALCAFLVAHFFMKEICNPQSAIKN